MSLQVRIRMPHPEQPQPLLDLDLTLPARGITALFGASGSGKTSLLRCIAGLDNPGQSIIRWEDRTWLDEGRSTPPHHRRIGYVFQEGCLFPHLDVAGNLDYAAHRVPAGIPARIDRARVVDWLGLERLLSRPVQRLSGGERQRVALARALLTQPRLLLMDEPLAALDAAAKQDILPRIRQVQQETDTPIIYVSHAREEVAQIADHLVLLDQGRILDQGPPLTLLSRIDLALAEDPDSISVLECHVSRHDEVYGLTELRWNDFAAHRLWVQDQNLPRGETRRVQIHARDISLSTVEPSHSSILNRIPGTIQSMRTLDSGTVLVRLEVGGQFLVSRITRRSANELALAVGQPLYAQIKSVALLNP